jgi:hypothetical protein
MRTYDAATLAYINAHEGIVARHLIWVIAKNRSTGLDETMGLWNGEYDTQFTISSEVRDYIGAGALLAFEPIRSGIGLDVQIHEFSLSGISSDVQQLVRGYDTRLAKVEVHRAVYDLDTNALVSEPMRILKGWVNEINFQTGAEGQESSVTLSVANASRALTRTLSAFRSDAAQKAQYPNDRFREYTDISYSVEVKWG